MSDLSRENCEECNGTGEVLGDAAGACLCPVCKGSRRASLAPSSTARISDRCEKCPSPKEGCIFPRCGEVSREALERLVIKAALDLFGATSSAAFKLPVPNTTPPLFVTCGEETTIAPSATASASVDAARWRALFGCKRIRVLGYARGGREGKDGPIRHIGFEWTSDQEPYCDLELQDGKDRLIEFTDALLSRDDIQREGKP